MSVLQFPNKNKSNLVFKLISNLIALYVYLSIIALPVLSLLVLWRLFIFLGAK